MSYRLPQFKKYMEETYEPDRSWMENGFLWAEKEMDDGTVLISIRTKVENCGIQIYWKSFMAAEHSGLNCVVNIRKNVICNEDIDSAVQKFRDFLLNEENKRNKILKETI